MDDPVLALMQAKQDFIRENSKQPTLALLGPSVWSNLLNCSAHGEVDLLAGKVMGMELRMSIALNNYEIRVS
jgi:hypothetical protein